MSPPKGFLCARWAGEVAGCMRRPRPCAAGLTLCGYTELLQMGVRAGRKGTGLGMQKNRQKGLQEQVAFEAGEERTGTTDKGAKCSSGTKAGSGEGPMGRPAVAAELGCQQGSGDAHCPRFRAQLLSLGRDLMAVCPFQLPKPAGNTQARGSDAPRREGRPTVGLCQPPCSPRTK